MVLQEKNVLECFYIEAFFNKKDKPQNKPEVAGGLSKWSFESISLSATLFKLLWVDF